MGVFFDGKVQGYSFRPPKKYRPTKQTFCCTRNLQGIVWNSGGLYYSELSYILLTDVKGEYLAKATENCKIFGSLLDKGLENLEDHGNPKVQDLVDEEICICSSYRFRPGPHFTVQKSKVKMFVKWIM